MTLCLMLLMSYSLIGEQAHEWIGIGMFVLFVLHHWLNRRCRTCAHRKPGTDHNATVSDRSSRRDCHTWHGGGSRLYRCLSRCPAGRGCTFRAWAKICTLCDIYKARGKTQEEIDRLVVLDVRSQQFFTEHGFTDQHAGGGPFANDETTMGWLFGLHEKGTTQ